MQIKINKLYAPILTSNCRYFMLWGGRSRGASHFATDYFLMLITAPKYFRGGFLRSTFNEVKNSLWRAFKDRVQKAADDGLVNYRDFAFNESELSVTYLPTGNSIISKGFRKTTLNAAANLKSLEGLTHAIIEEAEDVAEEEFMKFDDSLRTVLAQIQILLLFNPPGKNHWLIKQFFNLFPSQYKGWYNAIQKDIPELMAIHSNFTDNSKNVNESTKKNYLAYGDPTNPRYNPDFYYRNVLGLVSEGKRGRIFTNVRSMPLDMFNELPYKSFYGLDFGFNDPNAVVECKYHDGKLFVNELIYESGLDNDELAARMRKVKISKDRKVYADSARPDNIKSLNKYGFIVIGADKGPDSIEYGYRELLNLEIYYTATSKNLEKEFEEHSWELDKDKNPTDDPEDDYNHLIDGMRYAYIMHCKRKRVSASSPTDNVSNWDSWTDTGWTEPRELDEIDIDEFYK